MRGQRYRLYFQVLNNNDQQNYALHCCHVGDARQLLKHM